MILGRKPGRKPSTRSLIFNLHYMQQRYYDPIAGRFMSVDPAVADANAGKDFGRYVYVANNPYIYTDPDG